MALFKSKAQKKSNRRTVFNFEILFIPAEQKLEQKAIIRGSLYTNDSRLESISCRIATDKIDYWDNLG